MPLAVIMLLIILGCLGYRFYKRYRSDVKYQEGVSCPMNCVIIFVVGVVVFIVIVSSC